MDLANFEGPVKQFSEFKATCGVFGVLMDQIYEVCKRRWDFTTLTDLQETYLQLHLSESEKSMASFHLESRWAVHTWSWELRGKTYSVCRLTVDIKAAGSETRVSVD